MSTTTKRNYRATFILDNRGKEDSVDQIIDGVKKDILAVDGVVSSVEALGRRDFARVTDRNLPGATYIQVAFSAPATGPAALKERLRLNSTVYRTVLQTA
jgi:small subunit ribosomal protein S6